MKEKIPGQQPKQPEQTQPLQGRAEGRRSFQGLTTVEGSEPPQSSPGLPITPQEHPTLPPADGGRKNTSVQPSVVGNCIVRDLMPSSERVDEMLAEGHITGEQAAQQKKEALAFERVIFLGEKINAIRGQFFSIDNGPSTQEKRRLRAEYKSLRKESRLLKKQLRES